MLIYTKLWNPLRFTHSKLLLLNFAHAEKLPSMKIRTLYFESQSLKSIISVFQVSQEQKLCYRSPSKLLGKVQVKRKMPEILFAPINNFPFTLLLCVLFSWPSFGLSVFWILSLWSLPNWVISNLIRNSYGVLFACVFLSTWLLWASCHPINFKWYFIFYVWKSFFLFNLLFHYLFIFFFT